jgi:hypothetical protein
MAFARASLRFFLLLIAWQLLGAPTHAAAKVYVVLWFDTEDYILPASDDAALQIAEMLTKKGVQATFKVVGEKARTLERRQRGDVIAALRKHEIGYHSNYHSTQPSPALYLSALGWDEGVAEFERREGGGRFDVERIFRKIPSCYGQPGSSWGPQSYGAMRKWEMPVYLDAGEHVNLDGKPCYYCGILNLYKLQYTMRADLKDPKGLGRAQEKFAEARKALLAEGGGVVSIYYHPCEFVHREFWDGVNFRKGANPPREKWKEPEKMTSEESKAAFRVLDEYVSFMQRFDDVKFITAPEAAKLYKDRAAGRRISADDLKTIATAVGDEPSFHCEKEYALSAAEIMDVLNRFVVNRSKGAADDLTVNRSPYGPSSPPPALDEALVVDGDQFLRTAADVSDYLVRHERIPSAVWLGSAPVPPEAYLAALGRVVVGLLDGKKIPDKVEIKPAKLGAAKYVSADDPKLWTWVIFPPGFKAPAMMELAKRQAWTLKPALLAKE